MLGGRGIIPQILNLDTQVHESSALCPALPPEQDHPVTTYSSKLIHVYCTAIVHLDNKTEKMGRQAWCQCIALKYA
jgi:hypothetical protein